MIEIPSINFSRACLEVIAKRINLSKVVNACCRIRVLRAKSFFYDFQNLLCERKSLGIAALFVKLFNFFIEDVGFLKFIFLRI